MKKTSQFTVIIYGIGAAIWSIRVIYAVIYREYNDSFLFFVLNILCAVIWIAAFIRWLITYRSNKNE